MLLKLPSWMPSWRQVLMVLVPVALIPLAVTSKEGRCAYVILTMAVYWMAEVVPIPVTALIPVFAFPLLGVLSTADLCLVYMKETNMMFLGGLTVALAVEYCNLHKRIALFVILIVGQSPRRLMTGFMFTTMFLSMWISNTASTAMMVPIVDAILQQLYQTRQKRAPEPREKEDPRIAPHRQSRDPIAGSVDDVSMVNYSQHNSGFSSQETIASTYEAVEEKDTGFTLSEEETVMFAPPPNEECRRLRDMCYLATAYAANLGGTGAITGTGPNLVVKGVMDASFPDSNQINFATWMAYNVPGMLICVLLGWLWLQLLFVGFGKGGMLASDPEMDAIIARQLKKKYRALGRVTFHESVVLCLFICLVMLWLFRSPGFVTGWADVFKYAFPDVKIADATPAMFIVFLLFIIPKNPKFLQTQDPENVNQPQEFEGCLSWDVVQSKVPWGIVLLLGGGFAMAEAADKSNMSVLIGEQLKALDVLPKEAIVFLVCLVTAVVTEAASNTATASILLPVLKELSLGIRVNPIYLMLPASLCCSYAFMLPVATAPNAIVFGAAGMRTMTMVKAGIVMNLLCVAVAMLMINTLGVAMFDLQNFPDWANATLPVT